MLNGIYEQRKKVKDGMIITLSIKKEEYAITYGKDINDTNAKDILHQYLQYRDDDGEPIYVKIYEHKESNLIEIEATLNYIGNDHKDYDTTHELIN